MNRLLKDTIKIFLITLVAGISLGFVYQITKEPIAKAEENAKQKAYEEVFKEADSFTDEASFDAAKADKLLKDNGYKDDTINGVVDAVDKQGNLLGYVITVTTSAGYGGDIKFSMGVQLDGTLNGYKILSIAETAGLGMNATEDKFKSQFEGKNVPEFTVTKSSAASDSEIEAISGATITTKAVTYGVNAGLVYFNSMIEGGSGNE